MTRILVVTTGISSIALTNLEVARRLTAMGNDVAFASQDPIAHLVGPLGLPFIELAGEAPHRARAYYRQNGRIGKLVQFGLKWPTLRSRRRRAIEDLGIDEFMVELERFDPDLVLIDVEMHPHLMAAAAAGRRVVQTSTWLSMYRRADHPPLSRYEPPGPDADRSWREFRRWKRRTLLQQWLHTVGEDPRSLFLQVGRERGFPVEREIVHDQWLLPFNYRSLPVMMLSPPELDFPAPPALAEHHIGPVVLHDRPEPAEALSPSDRERLAVLPVAGRPLVYCSFGAQLQGDDADFFTRVLDAAQLLADCDLLVSLGGRLDAARFPSVPPNVHLFRWVSQPEVLARADAALVHGGIATLTECAYHGVPMALYPFWDLVDQGGNAARVEYHRLAVVGDRRIEGPAEIADRVRSALGDDDLRDAAVAMARRLRAGECDGRLAALIEGWLARPVPWVG